MPDELRDDFFTDASSHLGQRRPSRWRDLSQYVLTRLPLRITVLLSLFLALAAGTARQEWRPASLLWTAFALLLPLIVQFRLWDDLASLPEDCRRHPQRVLCRTQYLRTFHAVMWGGMLLNVMLVACLVSWSAGVLLIVADAGFCGVYVRLHASRWLPVIVIAKYAVFVAIASVPLRPDAGIRTLACAWIACCSVYLHDLEDDPGLKAWAARTWLLPTLLVSWVVAGELLAWDLASAKGRTAWVYALSVPLSVAGLLALLRTRTLTQHSQTRSVIGRLGGFGVSTCWFILYAQFLMDTGVQRL